MNKREIDIFMVASIKKLLEDIAILTEKIKELELTIDKLKGGKK